VHCLRGFGVFGLGGGVLNRLLVEQLVQGTASIADTVITYLDVSDLAGVTQAPHRGDADAKVLGTFQFGQDGIVGGVGFDEIGINLAVGAIEHS
jgi:hypothetical protein